MSLALDLALFLRNSKTKLDLSVTNIAVAYTLAFRVGTNTSSWVSQETLALELGIEEKNISIHCLKLVQSKLVNVTKHKKDKRRNVYNFSTSIMNYHSMNDAQKRKCHTKLGDIFLDRPQNQGLYKPRNHGLPDDAQTLAALEPCGIERNAQTAKVKGENNTKSKETLFCASGDAHACDELSLFTVFWMLYPKKKDKIRAAKVWKSKKLEEQGEEIIDALKLITKGEWSHREKQYIPDPSGWLSRERWKDEIIDQKNINKSGKKETGAERALRLCTH